MPNRVDRVPFRATISAVDPSGRAGALTSLVTFDFHNTIADCDEWFQLEIRDLPVRVLEHIAPDALQEHTPERITSSYRELRTAVMASGKEIDALNGVLRVLATFGISVERAEAESAIEDLMRDASRHATPIDGAVDAIRNVAAHGSKVGIVSSAVFHPFLEWTLERFGVAEDLAFILTSASSGYYKSNPEIYRAAMRHAGSDPGRSIHVGDSAKWDVWSAQQAGMRAVWFRNGHVDTLVDRDFESEPDHTVSSMTDVAPWVLAALKVIP
jgi:FMN phosphatase YigB (HAD superfamily)